MRSSLVFTVLLMINTSWANDFSIIVCDPLSSAESHIKNQNEATEVSQLLAYRTRIQTFIQGAERAINNSLKLNDTAAVAITCGMVDDATLGFTRPCYSDSGEMLDLKNIENICSDIASK